MKSAVGSAAGIRTRPALSLRDRMARGVLFRLLSRLREGRLILSDESGERVFGNPAPGDGLSARIRVEHPGAWSRIAFGGSVGAGRSYAEGEWVADDPTAVIRILARNREVLSRWRRGPARLMTLPAFLLGLRRRNTRRGSRDNIAAHYDLSNEFFSLFLDSRMMYSCAFFQTPESTLEEASRAKLDRICRKLALGPGDHLLEIGTGWGGLAIHAAREYGCRVTTTTISREQVAYARAAVLAAGLESRITVLDRDYRDLEGKYTKLVSVEMIEAVGPEYVDTYFAALSRLLAPEGVMLLQAIVIDDREYERAARSVDFIKHFIFPGSFIPSVARIVRSLRERTDMRILDLEDLTGHYATTLRHWRERFRDRSGDLDRLGFDRRFRRLWEFYFVYCEGGFRERRIGSVQLVLAKPGFRGSSGLVPAGDRE